MHALACPLPLCMVYLRASEKIQNQSIPSTHIYTSIKDGIILIGNIIIRYAQIQQCRQCTHNKESQIVQEHLSSDRRVSLRHKFLKVK